MSLTDNFLEEGKTIESLIDVIADVPSATAGLDLLTSRKKFVNTKRLSPAAAFFMKNGCYTLAPKGTLEWREFWLEEKRRCLQGYDVGDIRITGYHYYYLNYCPIMAVTKGLDGMNVEYEIYNVNEEQAGTIEDKVERFPDFWDSDYDFFWMFEIAKRGLKKSFIETLNLGIEICPDDIGKRHHITLFKARGKGYSYKAASIGSCNYHLKKKSKNFYLADTDQYLYVDGVITKVESYVAFNSRNCAWAQPTIKDVKEQKIAGYVEYINGIATDSGALNEINAVTVEGKEDKARGKRGELIVLEESGSFRKLTKVHEKLKPSISEGTAVFGTMLAYGTGGDVANVVEIEKMFYDPKQYNCIRVRNIWDEGKFDTFCGFFVPAYMNLHGFIDEDGNSDIVGAISYIKNIREEKAQGNDLDNLEVYIAEMPLIPREGFSKGGHNIFPVRDLEDHYNKLISSSIIKTYSIGLLRAVGDEIKFQPTTGIKPVLNYPINPKDDNRGAVCIIETPHRQEGIIPNNLYVIVVDPYAHDNAPNSKSIGSCYVVKRSNNFSKTFEDSVVAFYNGRPGTQDDFNEQVFYLARYYNAKIGFENNVGNMVEYAKRTRQLKWLYEEFKILSNRELQSTSVSRSYGMHMTKTRNDQAVLYIRDYLNEIVSVKEDGTIIKRLHTINDPGLILELIKYQEDGNFDRVSALKILMYYLKEVANKEVKATKESNVVDELLRIAQGIKHGSPYEQYAS